MAHLGDAPSPPADAPGPMRFGDPVPVLATLQEAGWEAEVDTVDLHLTPQGTAADLARSQLRIGPAAVLIAEREADDATKEAIVKDLTATYETMTEEGRVKVPAQIHFFTARPKG